MTPDVTDQETAFEEAAKWHAQIQNEDADWDGFARWLDADASHQRAYEQIAMIDDEVTRWADRHDRPAFAPPMFANDEPAPRPASSTRWRVAGGVMAASLIAAISVPLMMTHRAAPAVYYSADAGQSLVQLPDGSSARLDRGSRIAIADGGKGAISLEAGSAWFDVRHNPDRTLTVRSGDFVVRDIGTRFAVTRRGARVSVAVAQGLVDVAWQSRPAQELKAGQMLDGSGDGRTEIRAVDPGSVASWRDGRLICDNTPLSVVAADISRYTSKPVSVDPAVADLKLSGILLIEDGSHLVEQIKALLPVDSRREGDHVRLVRAGSRR